MYHTLNVKIKFSEVHEGVRNLSVVVQKHNFFNFPSCYITYGTLLFLANMV